MLRQRWIFGKWFLYLNIDTFINQRGSIVINQGEGLIVKLLAGTVILLMLIPTGVIAIEPSSQDNDLMLNAKKSESKTEEALAAAVSRAERTFRVTVGDKTEEHPFYGRGSKMGFAVDGVFGKELVLTRGVTYIFDVDTNIQHDFYFTAEPRGKGAGTLTDGIIGQFVYKAKVAFTPGPRTPDRVYYACRNHEYMGGLIHVVNKGETVSLENTKGKPVIPVAPAVISESEVQQKIDFAKLMVMGQTAKRVEDSGNTEAMGLLDKARSGISSAEAALLSGNNEEALTVIELALANAKSAIESVPPEENVVVDQRARYEELLKDFRSYKGTYEQRYNQSIKNGDQLFDKRPTPETIQQMDNAAVELSTKGDYKGASEILVKARNIVTTALVGVLEGEEVVYDKKFATSLEEYQYELARYRSYEELIPLALERVRPTKEATELLNGFVEKGKKIKREASDVARRGDYPTAVMGLQEATRQIQKALMVAGVK